MLGTKNTPFALQVITLIHRSAWAGIFTTHPSLTLTLSLIQPVGF